MKITKLGTKSGQNTGKAERLRSLTTDDINRMSLAEIREAANAVRKIVNENTRRLIKKGFGDEPIVNKEPLSTKGLKTVNDYRKFMKGALVRLRAKTGTVTGMRDFQDRMEHIIKGYSKLSAYQKDEIWTLIDTIRSMKKNLIESVGSPEAIEIIFDTFVDKLLDVNEAIRILTDKYEEMQEQEERRWAAIEGYTDQDKETELPF